MNTQENKLEMLMLTASVAARYMYRKGNIEEYFNDAIYAWETGGYTFTAEDKALMLESLKRIL